MWRHLPFPPPFSLFLFLIQGKKKKKKEIPPPITEESNFQRTHNFKYKQHVQCRKIAVFHNECTKRSQMLMLMNVVGAD